MSCLHTINRAPSQGLLERCLAVATKGDGILFIEDGVYHCLHDRDRLNSSGIDKLYGLREDMVARGLLDRNRAELEPTTYARFVELCCAFDKTVSWF